MSPEIRRASYLEETRGSFTAIAPFAADLSSLREGDGLSNGQQDEAAGRLSLSPLPIPRSGIESPNRDDKERSFI